MRGHPDPGGWLSPPLLLAEQGPGLGLTTTTGLRAGLAGPGQDPPGLAGLRCGQGAGAAGGGGAGTCLKPAGTVTFSLASLAGVAGSQRKSVWRGPRFARTGR